MRLRNGSALFLFTLVAAGSWVLGGESGSSGAEGDTVTDRFAERSFFLVYDAMASEVLGSGVYSLAGEKLGTVEDLVIKGDDQVASVVLSLDDGLFGLAERLVLIPYSDLLLTRGNRIYVDLEPAEVRRTAATLRQTDFGLLVREFVLNDSERGLRDRAAYEREWDERISKWRTRIFGPSEPSPRPVGSARIEVSRAWTSLNVAWTNLKQANDQAWPAARSVLENSWGDFEKAWSGVTQ